MDSIKKLFGTSDDPVKVREARADFNSTIESNHKRVIAEKGRINPDTANLIVKINGEYTKWLSDNPNANILEIQAKKDTYSGLIKNVFETEKSKNAYLAFIMGMDMKIRNVDDKNISSDERNKISSILQSSEKWLMDNLLTANKIQYDDKMNNIRKELIDSSPSPIIKNIVNEVFNNIYNSDPEKIKQQAEKERKNKELLAALHFSFSDIWDSASDTFWKVIVSLFSIMLCLFSGALASNSVIYRPISYRVLYFIFGAIPIFIIPILIYFALQRARYGPLHLYAMLPLIPSTFDVEIQNGLIMRLLRASVVYFPDQYIPIMASEYQASLEKFAQ